MDIMQEFIHTIDQRIRFERWVIKHEQDHILEPMKAYTWFTRKEGGSYTKFSVTCIPRPLASYTSHNLGVTLQFTPEDTVHTCMLGMASLEYVTGSINGVCQEQDGTKYNIGMDIRHG
ncbi:MAG: hypothetical protein IM613_12280 [Cytophagales bacterium]|nr:hypothetical protein [Cytophagales bacterium]